MSIDQKARIFIVGCPRSGTTLLQSLLTAHPQIASFPESHFFKYLVFNQRRWRFTLGALGIAPVTAKQRFEEFLDEIDQKKMQYHLPKFAIFAHQYAQAFINLLDLLTTQQGKNIWLEKTPGHLRYIDYIEKFVPGIKFIHILRNGADVVASMHEVTHKHPQIWGGARNIDQCVDRWVEDVRISHSYSHKPNHILIRYEQLVEKPQLILKELCEFIGTEFNETMLEDYSAAAKQVVLKNETWKASVQGEIKNANSKKFYELFDETQRSYILNKTMGIDIDELNKRPTTLEEVTS